MNSSTEQRTDSTINKGVGNVKETVGNVLGNKHLESEGNAQHATGQAQNLGAKATEAFENVKDSVAGAFSGTSKATRDNNPTH
ncbi:hypothetical protein BX666DRAFT_2163176 [Dichotomocladium elegans]|nr:hypothetical protein BX666DRAFT_2163176 [Dichotomocladium elegans]